MAYHYVISTVRRRALEATWERIDQSTVPLGQLFAEFKKVYMELTHPSTLESVYLDLIAYRDHIESTYYDLTIQQWLDQLGTRALPTVAVPFQSQEFYARYEDAFRAGYSIERVNLGRHPDSNLPQSDKHDLFLKKPDVNFNEMWRYMLISVNGFFHRAVLGSEGIYVIDGGRSCQISNLNHAGIISFREVGKLTCIPITSEMIASTNNPPTLSNGVFIQVPQSMQGQTVLLCIGGFLHLLDSTYRVLGDRLLCVDIANLNLADRIFHSMERINLQRLSLTGTVFNPNQVNVSWLYQDSTIEAYLTLPQSFIILLDTEQVYLRHHRLENTRLPGRYVTQPPFKRLPMVGTYRRLLDYRAFPEDDRLVLAADVLNEPNFNYRTTEWLSQPSIDTTCYSSKPFRLADAQLVEFGRYT